MKTLVLLLALIGQTAPDSLPGDAFARSSGPLTLLAGPSADHPGVLTLGADSVVRTGTTHGAFVEVFVPQGFPIYVHADYARADLERQQAFVTGQRVNARLLPSTVGLLPVGQVGQADGALQLLGQENGWLRVKAPATLELYAVATDLVPADASAAGAWATAYARREAERQRAMLAWQATDPAWLRAEQWRRRANELAMADLTTMTETQLLAHEAAVERLGAEAGAGPIEAEAEAMLLALASERAARHEEEAALHELRRAQELEAARIVSEARVLDLGLRYSGRGQELTLEGTVTRRTSATEDTAVYSIRDAQGRVFKLSSPAEVADLRELLGRKVVLAGRSLPLVNVDGPVLIVDEVRRVLP